MNCLGVFLIYPSNVYVSHMACKMRLLLWFNLIAFASR